MSTVEMTSLGVSKSTRDRLMRIKYKMKENGKDVKSIDDVINMMLEELEEYE